MRTRPSQHLRLAAIAVTLLVATAACGGDDDKDGDKASSAASTTTTTVAGSDGASTSAAPTTAAGTKGGPTTVKPGATGGGTQPPATTGGSGSATTAPSGGGSATTGAKPGTYRYKATGTRHGGAPTTTSRVDEQQTLVVDPVNGAEQHSVMTDSNGGTETTFRFLSNGAHISYLKVGQINAEFRPDPPVLAFPQPATTGATWSWDMTSTDGKSTIHGDFKIAGNETVTIGGTAVDTVKIEDTLVLKTTFNGAPVTATVTETRWISVKHALTMKQHSVTDVGAFGKSDVTAVLQSLDPA